ncbi:tetratricopeptide repeat protein [Thalassoroseus pseudoceratinae]|uniref:tetratricopeptide repeat protein n=1 Tax=Thalassoroseus pseudoceratinae TaxID=2713176 RepID=UPI00142289D8|nr:hypothetical protein [Thalassoroseus pseudoceratinae]
MKSTILQSCIIMVSCLPSVTLAEHGFDRLGATARVPLRQAEQHLNRGMDLADRGAVHSAASEFRQALHLVASAADVRTRSQRHITALTEGLEALSEADEFLMLSGGANVAQTMRRIVAGHQTPVFTSASDLSTINPLTAMQEYYFYARDRLSVAGANEPVASYAIYGLGRLQPFLGAEDRAANPILDAKMLAYYRAAIRVWQQNNRAANEIGVLLARLGDLNAAEQAFRQSYAITPQPEVLRNLQKTQQLRLQPHNRRDMTMSSSPVPTEMAVQSAIRWVEPSAFRQRNQPLTVQNATRLQTAPRQTE